jgi:energy-coupling factor transporter transmembrane protein EcfT
MYNNIDKLESGLIEYSQYHKNNRVSKMISLISFILLFFISITLTLCFIFLIYIYNVLSSYSKNFL